MATQTPGRYNLHRLGWKSFEDLVIEICRTILGETVTPFREGGDGGRDGFFSGQISGEFSKLLDSGRGKVVIQCKHTSAAGEGLKWSNVSKEIPKIRELVNRNEADLYVIFSNRRLSGEDEIAIRNGVEEKTGVKRCQVFDETYIEGKIQGDYRLLRRVPRLYGVGDLSQILSQSISEQTRMILEDLKHEQAVFVPTPSYLDAVHAMETYRFVVLVGPPASGKSAIAMNLCMVLGAENNQLEVLRVDAGMDLSSVISASDPHRLYWIDDFLGANTFDSFRADRMTAAFDRCRAAMRIGNKFIFTTRDYILRDAHQRLRKAYVDFFQDNRVVVRVDNLNFAAKERILYNHVKLGDLDAHAKIRLKPFLPMVSRLQEFTPELARRLGTGKFHAHLQYDERSIKDFIERPVHFFRDVISDLGESERAAVAYLLLSNNALPDPVTHVPDQIRNAYGADVASIRRALESLRGSLTKINIVGNRRIWQVHHPTMIDAMHEHIREYPAMLDLFVAAAPLEVLLRDCATVEAPNRLFVPESLYSSLFARLLQGRRLNAAKYLVAQGDDFLKHAVVTEPDKLAAIMEHSAETFGNYWGLHILARLRDLDINFECGQSAVESNAEEALWAEGCSDVLHHEDFANPLSDSLVRRLVRDSKDGLDQLLDWMLDAAREDKDASRSANTLDDVSVLRSRLKAAAKRLLNEDEYHALMNEVEDLFLRAESRLNEYVAEMDDSEDYRDDWESSPGWSSVPDIFSDVEE